MNEELNAFKKDVAATLKSAQKTLEHTATTSAKIAVKRAMKKSSNHDQHADEVVPQTTGPTMADVWLKTLENSVRNAVSPEVSLLAIEKMIKDEKNKLIENENKKKETAFKSIIGNVRNNVTTLLG